VEYETRREAEAAIKGTNGSQLLEQTLHCDFAFVRPPQAAKAGAGAGNAPRRQRSLSPKRGGALQNRLG
jgi:RNA-binding protein 8A